MKQFIHDYSKLPDIQFFLQHWIGCILFMIILTTCYVLVITIENKQQAFDLLGETVKQIKNDEHVTKQPHVRIEFDDIRDVPKVWVDGELMDDGANDKALDSLKVDWKTDTVAENHKYFDINYYDLTGERPMSMGFSEGSVM